MFNRSNYIFTFYICSYEGRKFRSLNKPKYDFLKKSLGDMSVFKPCLKETWCRVLPSPHPEPGSEQLDQRGVKALQELEHCAGCLGDICTASCRPVPQIKTQTGKQLFLIICWHLLSLELLRLIYKTGHLSLRLLLQSCSASGRVHFSSPFATPPSPDRFYTAE